MTDPVIIKGNPTDEEVAAVVAALAALTSATPAEAHTPTSRRPNGWSAYWRSLRTPPHPSPDAWRTSLRGP